MVPVTLWTAQNTAPNLPSPLLCPSWKSLMDNGCFSGIRDVDLNYLMEVSFGEV